MTRALSNLAMRSAPSSARTATGPRLVFATGVALSSLLGCHTPNQPPGTQATVTPSAPPSSSAAPESTAPCVAPAATAPSVALAATAATPICPAKSPSEEPGVPCGELGCRAFSAPGPAIARLLSETHPRLLAVGEAHLQQDVKGVRSSTALFTEQLPWLCAQSTELLIELWLGRSDCGDQRVKEVAARQREVTSPQASINPTEFQRLGRVAQSVGMHPQALTPSCEDYRTVLAAGSSDIDAMLQLIERRSQEQLEALLAASRGERGLVISYGGALHNDAQPSAARAPWSFGPAMLERTAGAYVELDLLVREQVKDSPAWRDLPVTPIVAKDPLPDRTLLFQTGPKSYVLVFARQVAKP